MRVSRLIKLAVFDLDGTLLDTLDDLVGAMNASLKIMGFPIHAKEEYKRMIGDGVMELGARVLPAHERSERNVLYCVREMKKQYEKCWDHSTRPYEGIPALINDLLAQGISLAVLSNKPEEFTVKMVRHFFGPEIFCRVRGAQEGLPCKPDPKILKEILSELNIFVHETVLVGDSGVDIITAQNGGCLSLGALWGFRDRAELESAGADYIVTHPGEIADIIYNRL